MIFSVAYRLRKSISIIERVIHTHTYIYIYRHMSSCWHHILRPGGAPPYMIFVFWWYVNHLWCNLNTLGPLTKIWFFLPFRPVRLPWQPDLCAEMLVLGHIWGAKSEKLKKVLENFFLIIKHEMNIKLFTEGFLEILKKNSTCCVAAGGQKVLFLANKRLSFKKYFEFQKTPL